MTDYIDFTEHYCVDTDITFITEDSYTAQGDPLTTKVIGFYFGEPNPDETHKVFAESLNDPQGALIAHYER